MKSLQRIIKEEVSRYLKESDEDIDWDLYEIMDDVKQNILTGFFSDRKKGIKNQPWQLVPFARLKKIWEDYMNYGYVRDIKGLEMIDDIIQDNIIKLYINTELVGHSTVNPQDDFDEYGYKEEDMEDFYNYIDKYTDYGFNDFGGKRLGLTTLLVQLRRAKTPEEKLLITDQILNVVHWTSDLAAWFVEGGSSALSQLSASPSEVPQ